MTEIDFIPIAIIGLISGASSVIGGWLTQRLVVKRLQKLEEFLKEKANGNDKTK